MVSRDITFGSLDVIRDMEKIMQENKSNLLQQQVVPTTIHLQHQQNEQDVEVEVSESRYYSPSQTRNTTSRNYYNTNNNTNNNNNNGNNNLLSSLHHQQLQISIDRTRSAERAVAGQALLELKREIESHQHTRTSLQKKIYFVTSQYEKLLHSVTSGEDGEYWQLSPERVHHEQQEGEDDMNMMDMMLVDDNLPSSRHQGQQQQQQQQKRHQQQQ